MIAEYAIIEDDLANLKRLQKENKTLRAQLDSLGANAPTATLKTEIPPTESKTDAPAAQEREQVEERAVQGQLESIVAAPPATETVPTAELATASNHSAGTQESSKTDETNFESLINDVEKSLAQDATSGETTSEESKAEAQNKSEAELQADFEKMLNS